MAEISLEGWRDLSVVGRNLVMLVHGMGREPREELAAEALEALNRFMEGIGEDGDRFWAGEMRELVGDGDD